MPSGYHPGGFRCEPPERPDEIGEYLAFGDAARDQVAGVSRTYLVFSARDVTGDLLDLGAESRIVPIAYYTLQADAIVLAPGERVEDAPYTSAPAVKIARIGVGCAQRGRGLGRELFGYIEAQVLLIAQRIDVRFITLDAVAGQIGFYEKLGFHLTAVEHQPATEADHDVGDRSMWYDLGAIGERPDVSELRENQHDTE